MKLLYTDKIENIQQPDTSTSEPCTNLPDDVEDTLRKFMFVLFDLSFNEIMMLKSIMNQTDLTQFARDMEILSKKNQKFSRFRAFQTRKSLGKKLGDTFLPALLTVGQRKELKKSKTVQKYPPTHSESGFKASMAMAEVKPSQTKSKQK